MEKSYDYGLFKRGLYFWLIGLLFCIFYAAKLFFDKSELLFFFEINFKYAYVINGIILLYLLYIFSMTLRDISINRKFYQKIILASDHIAVPTFFLEANTEKFYFKDVKIIRDPSKSFFAMDLKFSVNNKRQVIRRNLFRSENEFLEFCKVVRQKSNEFK
jgi:hypothetical protein